SAGKDGRFGIGESNVSINSFTKANIFLETGSCPSPKSFVVFKTRHEISYQSLCDAVQQFRPFVHFGTFLLPFCIVRQPYVT
ncbi:virulence factor TspB C-terminal domain-related protein, partial [Kingella kingae]|uniref:virulence factor TspB C-terminal domain-related protein n=1 Tax=Kingella kingae TaxID=504 RepID=UPI00255057ED